MNTENNKKIAEFMGIETINKDKFDVYRLTSSPYSSILLKSHVNEMLQFHNSWDLIIPVVEKIESLDEGRYYITITHKSCRVQESWYKSLISESIEQNTTIEAVYNACINFIDWYNKNSAKEK